VLRWLLTQATGTIGNVAHQLETRALDIDDYERRRLLDDLAVLDEELGVVRMLLDNPVDWDAEYRRLLAGETPPLENDDEYDEQAGR
jgi:hypothetical protein